MGCRIPQTVGHELVDTEPPQCSYATAMELTRLAFTVNSFDADAFGFLIPAALAGYLQEAAGRSADSLGCSLADLNRRGLTWVLARQRLVLDRPLRWGDRLVVETWPSGLDRLAALRDFRILCDETEIGRALTTWFVIDLNTRRPVRPNPILPERLHSQTEHVLPAGAPSLTVLGLPDDGVLERRFRVRFADIDPNLHVTNSSYIAWGMEAVEEATWRTQWMTNLDVQFLAECQLGGFVLSRSKIDGDRERLHAIVREEDGKELARMRTIWAPRS